MVSDLATPTFFTEVMADSIVDLAMRNFAGTEADLSAHIPRPFGCGLLGS